MTNLILLFTSMDFEIIPAAMYKINATIPRLQRIARVLFVFISASPVLLGPCVSRPRNPSVARVDDCIDGLDSSAWFGKGECHRG